MDEVIPRKQQHKRIGVAVLTSDKTDFKEINAIRCKEGHSKNINTVGRNTPINASQPKTTAEKHEEKIDKIW